MSRIKEKFNELKALERRKPWCLTSWQDIHLRSATLAAVKGLVKGGCRYY